MGSEEDKRAWVLKLMEHASHGRRLICMLAGVLQRPLPTDQQDIRDLFLAMMELLDPLYRGVSCLEARLSIVNVAASNTLYPSPVYT